MRHTARVVCCTVALAVVGACGSSESSTTELPSVVDSPTRTSAVSTSQVEVATAMPTGPLSIEPALLPETAFGAPWEHQGTRLDQIAYGNGPNQSDCDPYWMVESILGLGGGSAFWWSDGGNAQHIVTRVEDPEAFVDAALAVPEQCPKISWSEGDYFTTSEIELGDDIAGFESVTDPASDRTWFAVTAHGDLVSMLWVPLWPRLGATEFLDITVDDFAAVARQMREVLVATPEAELSELTTTTIAAPPTTITPTTTMSPTTTTAALDDPLDDPSGLSALLLTEDVMPLGWEPAGVERYIARPIGDAFIEACPAGAAFDALDVGLEWRAGWNGASDSRLLQIVGRMPSAAEASAAIEQLADVGSCDLSAQLDGGQASGGTIDVPGTTAATRIVFAGAPSTEVRIEMVMFALDDVIMVTTAETVSAGAISETTALELAAIAAMHAGLTH